MVDLFGRTNIPEEVSAEGAALMLKGKN